MKHDAAVKESVVRSAFLLFTNKAVLKPQVIVRKRRFVIQVAKLIIELAVLIVSDFDYAIFYPKRISVVFANQVVIDLDKPILSVIAIK
jgi:hypothetical protein